MAMLLLPVVGLMILISFLGWDPLNEPPKPPAPRPPDHPLGDDMPPF